MKGIKTLAVLVGLAAIAIFSSDAFTRGRMYNPQLGRFMQRDPIGYIDGMSLYQYTQSNPIIRTDPTGGCSKNKPVGISVIQKAKALSKCGSAEYKVQWSTPRKGDRWNGWIIQHITWKASVSNCAGKKLTPKNPDGLDFWEGWKVRNGDVYIGDTWTRHGADTFRTVDEGDCTKGTIMITGSVKGIQNYDLRKPPWGNAVPEAGSLPTMKKTPPGWNEAGTRSHTLKVTWDCCASPKKKKKITTQATGTP